MDKRTVKLKVLNALMDGTIKKDEAKVVISAGHPSKYIWPVFNMEGKEEFIRIKVLMERLGFIPKIRFTNDDY